MNEEEYVDWINNPGNEFNCSECPENIDYVSADNCYPCGQQNCWVTCHIREED